MSCTCGVVISIGCHQSDQGPALENELSGRSSCNRDARSGRGPPKGLFKCDFWFFFQVCPPNYTTFHSITCQSRHLKPLKNTPRALPHIMELEGVRWPHRKHVKGTLRKGVTTLPDCRGYLEVDYWGNSLGSKLYCRGESSALIYAQGI